MSVVTYVMDPEQLLPDWFGANLQKALLPHFLAVENGKKVVIRVTLDTIDQPEIN